MTRNPVWGPIDRRAFLQGASVGAGAWLAAAGTDAAVPEKKPRVAVVVTEVAYRDHGHVILENFLEPYLFDGRRTDPGAEVVSLYVDQFPAGDMARDISRRYGIPIYPTIAAALCLGRTRLAVDAVISIGEHGNYPMNAKYQIEYPRKRFFDAIVAVFEKSGRVVPVFNDKHLSYRWDWAEAMYATARRLKIPFLAGSSVPLAQRRPTLELPDASEIREAVAIHGGPLEIYDFHGLEVLQSMIEARRGGETGVTQVQFLEGEALWEAAEAGLWSTKLADAALAAELGPGKPTVRTLARTAPYDREPPRGIVLHYRDGVKGMVLKVGRSATRWDFACRIDGDDAPRTTQFYTGPWNNRCLFKALSHAIQVHFREGKAPYPVERTLLTTGLLEAAMESRFRNGAVVETPHLGIAYAPQDFRALRETGATWEILTPDVPQPKGIDLSGRRG